MERLSQKQFGILGELLFRLGIHLGNPRLKESRIMTEYIVGLRHGKRSEVLTIEAEDALVAALKAKHKRGRAAARARKGNQIISGA
jgi:hypothetical protein